MIIDTDQQARQDVFGRLTGISQQRVSQLLDDGVLERGGAYGEWLLAYASHLREQAAGRMGEAGGLDLVHERAALAREQRIGHEIKNALARGEYAPIGLLSETLAAASQGVSDRFEQLPGLLRKACPDLPDEARQQIETVIAAARNEWAHATVALVVKHINEVAAKDDEDEDDGEPLVDSR